jgi:hypothetical protein
MSYQIAYDTARAPPRGAALVAFMEDFYRTSDTESLHEKYVQSFTEDATLIMGPKEAKGASGMLHPHFSITTYKSTKLCSKCSKAQVDIDVSCLRILLHTAKTYPTASVNIPTDNRIQNRNPPPPPRSLDSCCRAPTHAYTDLLQRRRRNYVVRWCEL